MEDKFDLYEWNKKRYLGELDLNVDYGGDDPKIGAEEESDANVVGEGSDPKENKLEQELSKFSNNVSVQMGKYSQDRPDSDPLKGKGYGIVKFITRNNFPDNEWNQILNVIKDNGYEITQDSNYYDTEPGERDWFPSVNFIFPV